MDFLSNISLTPWLYPILATIYIASIASCIYVVLRDNRNPIKSLAWVTVLIFLPFVGFILYIFFGRSLKGLRLISKQKKRKLLQDSTSQNIDINQLNISETNKQLIKLAHNLCGATYYSDNHLNIYTSGKDKFQQYKTDIKNASQYIYIQYYIFNDDSLGREIADILKQKVKEGVIVRVIYDHIGSFKSNNKFFKEMRDAGIDVHPFFKVTFPQLANRINWRNHRKITAIDGNIGYIGGMNIADRYINGPKIGQIWRDTHIRVNGPIINALIQSFAIDWNFMSNNLISEFANDKHNFEKSDTGMQLITSGPNTTWSNTALIAMKTISNAKKSIYLQTPYFLPTESLLKALQTAALADVDVRIMIPKETDSILLKYASYSYIEECLKSGIKIYLYNKGMLHSKNLIIDNEIVYTGSTNFDFRSFEHNFEANVIIYDNETNKIMREIFFNDINDSDKLSVSSWNKRSRLQRLGESILRLLSPVL